MYSWHTQDFLIRGRFELDMASVHHKLLTGLGVKPLAGSMGSFLRDSAHYRRSQICQVFTLLLVEYGRLQFDVTWSEPILGTVFLSLFVAY